MTSEYQNCFQYLNKLVKDKRYSVLLQTKRRRNIWPDSGHNWTYSRISSGLRFSSSESIKHEQYRHAFSQYRSGDNTYYLDFQDAFSDDIDERLKRNDKFIITVTMTQNDKKRVVEQGKPRIWTSCTIFKSSKTAFNIWRTTKWWTDWFISSCSICICEILEQHLRII